MLPRLFSFIWWHKFHKITDIILTIPVGASFWYKSIHEPLILGVKKLGLNICRSNNLEKLNMMAITFTSFFNCSKKHQRKCFDKHEHSCSEEHKRNFLEHTKKLFWFRIVLSSHDCTESVFLIILCGLYTESASNILLCLFVWNFSLVTFPT